MTLSQRIRIPLLAVSLLLGCFPVEAKKSQEEILKEARETIGALCLESLPYWTEDEKKQIEDLFNKAALRQYQAASQKKTQEDR